MEKYSDKFLNNLDKLKPAVIGIEFEFYTKDLSYYKTLEMLNLELHPIKVWGFRQYHSSFKPDSKNFKIEPDLSGGSNMVELVTGPMGYFDAKYYLIKILKFIQKYGHTNDKSSIHFNISFKNSDLDLKNLNVLKMILNLDEEEIWRYYPSRKNNIYSRSISHLINIDGFYTSNISSSLINSNINLPIEKYYGVNFTNISLPKDSQRLEFRYIGGEDYHKNPGQLIYFMDKFIINTYDMLNIGLDDSDMAKLQFKLNSLKKFKKNILTYNEFIVNYSTIQIQIDQSKNYNLINFYYERIREKLFNVLNSIDDLNDCIINYVTATQTLEIVDGDVKSNSNLSSIEFINCQIEGIFENCFFSSCNIKNSRLYKSNIYSSECSQSKILSCKVESYSNLIDCYFQGGYMNANMSSGVFRSGKLGPYSNIDSSVKIVTDSNNFFNTKDESDESKTVWNKKIKKTFR